MEEEIHFLSYEPSIIIIFNPLFPKFVKLNKKNSDSRADRHFAGDKNSKLEINTLIWYKQFNQWLPGILWLLGKGYGLVIADGEEIWVPLCHIRYREGPQDWTPLASDEADAKGLVNDLEGANEETPLSESLPDMGSSEKHDSSGWANTEEHWNSYDSR